MPDTRMPHCLYAWQHREQMFAVGHFPILTNSLTLQIFCNIDLYTHINISSMNASSFVYIDVVIICTMMSFYQQILHSFSCYNVLCIGNLTYAGHFAVCPSTCNFQSLHFSNNGITLGIKSFNLVSSHTRFFGHNFEYSRTPVRSPHYETRSQLRPSGKIMRHE